MHGLARPLPGSGLVIRAGDLLLICADGGDGVDELIAVVAEAAGTGGDGAALVRQVAALLAADLQGRFPACALSGPASDGRLAVLVHGQAVAEIATGMGVVTLSGADAITSVDQLIAGPIGRIQLQLPAAGEADPRARLDSGIVPGAGVLWTSSTVDAAPRLAIPAQVAVAASWTRPTPPHGLASPVFNVPVTAPPPPPAAPVSPAAPPPAPDPAAPGEDEAPYAASMDAASMDAAPVDPPDNEDPPAADAGPDGAEPEPAVERSHVIGVFCPKGHFIDPRHPYCPVCGISLAQQTVVAREGVRPVLGSLLLDDGETVPLDIDYVIGRDPRQDPDAVAGLARPLKIVDSDGVVSRRHARISLVGWDVQIMDLGSSNGTYIQPPGAPERQQVAQHVPVVIRPGTVITLGRRWLRFEPPRTA